MNIERVFWNFVWGIIANVEKDLHCVSCFYNRQKRTSGTKSLTPAPLWTTSSTDSNTDNMKEIVLHNRHASKAGYVPRFLLVFWFNLIPNSWSASQVQKTTPIVLFHVRGVADEFTIYAWSLEYKPYVWYVICLVQMLIKMVSIAYVQLPYCLLTAHRFGLWNL